MVAGAGGGITAERHEGTSLWGSGSVLYLDWSGHIGVCQTIHFMGTFYVCKFKLNKADL